MMKRAALAFSALMLASCGNAPADNAPPAYLSVEAPLWTSGVKLAVTKRSCRVFNEQGQVIHATRSGVDLGNGLYASRSRRRCHLTDTMNNITCTWNRSERLMGCQMPNPAYTAYLSAKR